MQINNRKEIRNPSSERINDSIRSDEGLTPETSAFESLYHWRSTIVSLETYPLYSLFGVVFFVSKSLLGIEGQKKVKKFTILTRKPRSHVGMLIYQTWPIGDDDGSPG